MRLVSGPLLRPADFRRRHRRRSGRDLRGHRRSFAGEAVPPVSDGSVVERLGHPPFRQVRDLPGWGTIFSPYVRFIRPDGAEEEDWFVELVDSYLEVLSSAIQRATPDSPDSLSTIERYEGQLNYCLKQKRNDKTRRVLEKAFNPAWAEAYIENLLFDNPPLPA